MLINNSKTSKDNGWWNLRFLEAGLFLLIVFIEAGILLYLILDKRIVGGHDGFEYFYLQYYFLNNVVNYGEIPQWTPFVTQGTIVTWWYIIQCGMLQNIFLLTGSLLKDLNFLPLFYIGYFVEALLLLTGAWLLCRRYYTSPLTVFFVSISLMGSCIWMLQPWWNFHFYYAIPMILYLIHKFLDEGKWRYFLAAGNLLFIQSLGGLPYFLPVISLVIFLYFLFYAAFSCKSMRYKIKAISFGVPFFITLLIIFVFFIALYAAMNFGIDQLVNYNFRDTDGAASLDLFLSYGGQLSFMAFLELLAGVSPALDYTLYIGVICVPLILFGLIFNSHKNNIHIYLTAIVILFFGMSTWVSIVFYYCWPMMRYFRHLALVTPIIKIFLCFLAGFGFEALLFKLGRWQSPWIRRIALMIISVMMLVLSFYLWFLSTGYPDNSNFFVKLVKFMVPWNLPIAENLFNNKYLITQMFNHTIFTALIASILFLVLSFSTRKKLYQAVIYVLLLTHCVNVCGFKFLEIKSKTVSLSDEKLHTIDFQTMPYPKRREATFEINNHRVDLLNVLPFLEPSILNFSVHAFLFKDELGNAFRTNFCLRPFDNYIRAYWGQDIDNISVKPLGLILPARKVLARLEFPKDHPAALRISGATEDKIQFFSHAEFIASDDIIASNITHPEYKGDIIFLSPPECSKSIRFDVSSEVSGKDLSEDKRIHFSYQVRRFDSNNLVVTTNVKDLESAWLLYSDVWHPLWRATVNGKQEPVYKANLAYKAVKLEKGFNEVHFFFKSRFVSFFHYFVGLNSLLWLIILFFLAGRIVLQGLRVSIARDGEGPGAMNDKKRSRDE